MTIGITGSRTTIVEGLLDLVPEERAVRIGRNETDDVHVDLAGDFDVTSIPADLDRYVLAAGLLMPKRISDQTFDETAASLAVNLSSTVRICEYLLTSNPRARIAVLGSESFRGSFDTTYFLAKAAIVAYVQQRRIAHPGQQLVVVSPTIIMDSGMTQRRADLDRVEARAARAPKQRFLRSDEVSKLLHFVLYVDDGMLTNTVVSLNGGEFAR